MRSIKFLFILFFCLAISSQAISTISNYTIPSTIPLNKNLTIYGISSGGSGELCSFYIFDIKDQNQVLVRLSDGYTDSIGSFYAEWIIKEPLFRRGSDYNALTVCGSSQTSRSFQITQKQDIAIGITPERIGQEFKFWTDSNNSTTAFFVILTILTLAGLGAIAWRNFAH